MSTAIKCKTSLLSNALQQKSYMKFFSFFLLVIFFSCSADKIPDDILAPEKMQEVLWDMIRADEFLVSYVIKDTSVNRKTESIKLYDKVFDVHDISKSAFEKSFKYYQLHPEILQPIMDSLNARKTDLEIGEPLPIDEDIPKPAPVRINAE